MGATGMGATGMSTPADDPYWSRPIDALLAALGSRREGLSSSEAAARLARDGPNVVSGDSRSSAARILLRQFRSPLVIVLLVASVIAGMAGETTDTLLIAGILAASTVLGFLQEYRAARSLDALRHRLGVSCRILRDGVVAARPVREVVVGDIIALSAGSLIPADGVLAASRDCFVIQSVLTGESLPVEKLTAPAARDASLSERTNAVYMGTSVRSGIATMVVVRTGANTVFGGIASRLRLRRPATDFENGVRRFSTLLTEFVLVLTVIVIVINVLLDRPAHESLLFAVALAVGITPELLPAIVTFTLARGARDLASQGVLVRRLAAIENLGSMDVLCADKTGTLTVGAAQLAAAVDPQGESSARVMALAATNARLQTGLPNPLDEVIVAAAERSATPIPPDTKVDECPYDFSRKRMSIAVHDARSGSYLTITKGALPQVLTICTDVRRGAGTEELSTAHRAAILARFERHARDGLRVLAVASRATSDPVARESEMVFEGLLLFEDPTKPGIRETLRELRSLGVRLKIVTGDNRHTARHVAEAVGIEAPHVISGEELQAMRDEALWQRARIADVFAEVDPNQKERIIEALRKHGHVVGYIGDGINDAPALHAADVGISVDGAVDVAREAADLVLLEHDLRVLARGIREGRVTFANTQKYILSTTSANFGNMLSMAAASAFLPFLPLLAPQILLNNLLTDIPSVALAGDHVDPEDVQLPSRWNMRRIRNFTIVFGGISSAFDVLTFFVLVWLAGPVAATFRSGWFLESLATEVLVLLAIRTPRPLFASKPSRSLAGLSVLVLAGSALLVQTAAGGWLSFVPLPATLWYALGGITLAYVASVELTKRRLYRLTAVPASSAAATWRLTARKLSGVTETESIPHSTRNSANSG